MMNLTVIYCLSAYVAVISHIAVFAYNIGGAPEIKAMIQRFTPKQSDVYQEVRKERRLHYGLGLGLGLLVASVFAFKNKLPSPRQDACAFVGLATMIAHVFYNLMPKKFWMVEHLDNAGDVQRWNAVYRKFRMLTGYAELVGFVLFVLAHR